MHFLLKYYYFYLRLASLLTYLLIICDTDRLIYIIKAKNKQSIFKLICKLNYCFCNYELKQNHYIKLFCYYSKPTSIYLIVSQISLVLRGT